MGAWFRNNFDTIYQNDALCVSLCYNGPTLHKFDWKNQTLYLTIFVDKITKNASFHKLHVINLLSEPYFHNTLHVWVHIHI